MVAVVGNTGTRLMPVHEAKARKLLNKKRAKIYKHNPFTIQLLDREDGTTQPMEYKCDTGYDHIGISICTEKKEIVHDERDLIGQESERHNDQRKYRRIRRNRKTRYRKPRFNNRKGMVAKDGFAPSMRNKRDRHVDLYKMFAAVMPITHATFEMGQFDTQLLKAIEKGEPVPVGADYQHGERYMTETLREAVFTRDNHTCAICGRGIKQHAIMHAHHVGYWKGDRTNRIGNMLTVCEKCHTSKNHKPSGKLYGLEPVHKSFKGATFMTMVRYDMFERIKAVDPNVECHIAYGAMTKLERRELGIKKTHANDAYAMGKFHPKWKADFKHYQKRRRNNRILEKFYDAKIVDTRTGEIAPGASLGCERTKRSIPRNNPGSLRKFRGIKVSKGKRVVRNTRYPIQPGDRVLIDGKWKITAGSHCKGTRIIVNGKSVSVKQIKKIIHAGGWMPAIEKPKKKQRSAPSTT